MKFSDIIGNESTVQRLRSMIDNDRLPHALLLHGEPGIPKLALARAAAQYLHCQNRHDGDSCGECPSCRQHQSFNHTDTYYSFPYTNRKNTSAGCTSADYIVEWKQFLNENPVESYERWLELLKNENAQPQIMVRESEDIIRKMTLSAYISRYKVLIMWLPEKMREDAANKLLKLIEEPYDDCKFILVSDNAKGVLGTIYSRTQRLELRRPGTATVAQHLQQRYSIDEREAMAIAAPADGNVALAERALQHDSELEEFSERFRELMRTAYLANLAKLKDWSDSVADMKREKSRRFLSYASRQVRENYIYNLHTPGLNYLTREEEQFSKRFAPFINERNVERLAAELQCAANDIRGNANARITLFDLAIKVSILIKRP